MSAAQPLPLYDEAAVRRHVAMIHLLAKGVPGEVVVVGVGEDPVALNFRGKPGKRIPTQVRRYEVGDIDGTVMAVMAQQGRPHANVYMPFTVVRLGLEPGDRGGFSDINAVLALTVDSDADKGEAPVEPPIAPSVVIESSPGNRQLVFHLDRPLAAADAELLAKALHRATRSDSGTGDVAHVWRVPGGWNWPNYAKLKRGRPPDPVPVRVLDETPGRRVSADELREALAPWIAEVEAEMAAANRASERPREARPQRDDEPPIDIASLPAGIRELIEAGIERGAAPGDRSGAFHKIVLFLHARGHSQEVILDLLEQHPGGIAAKFEGRLADGIRYSFDKGEERAQANFDAAAAEEAKADDADGWPFRLALRGVERRVEITDRSSGETTVEWRWLCSHLEVAAHTRDADGDDWGRLLVVRDRDGRSKEWAMPMAMLAGEGVAYRERLLSLGLTMAPGKAAREALHEYVSTARPSTYVHCVSRIGWHGRSFALPDAALQSAAAAERTVLQNGTKLDNAIRRAGTLDAWKRDVAALAVGNSRLALALSTAFAAPLLHLIGGESGGFHLRGASSSGKSTTLVVAGSAWGGGGIRRYQRLWRATSNGLEGVAALHCDALLCLDEMGQVDGREAGAIAYMLANGIGKSRAGRSGEARASAEWRILFLSSGEISLSDKMAEDGRRSAVGQEVRLVDIEADAGRGLGLFEDLHGFASGDAFARHLKGAAGLHYGHAARAFLRHLVDDLDAAAPAIAGSVAGFLASHCPGGADGQVSRICGRFGLTAAAGDMATKLGILPWPEGEAERAAARCFRDWLRKRGDARPAEERAAIAAVRRFVELHGGSRFELLGDLVPRDASGHALDHRIVNRAGFRRKAEGGGAEYLILPEVWRTEVCAGLDASAVARTLAAQGLIALDREGKPQVKVRVPSSDNALRLYVVRAAILDGAQEADVEIAA